MLCILLATIVSAFFLLPSALGQGALTPPGAPTPTMKSLDQIESRTPISSLPFTITNSGSYYITTNLFGTFGITIQSNVPDVTLDLNGFAMIGGIGAGNAISATIFPGTNCVVKNGSIRNWFGGVSTGPSSRVEQLQVSSCSSFGISIGDDSVVRHCTIINNSSGMAVGFRSLVEDCLVSSNSASRAITIQSGSTVTGCIVAANAGTGIFANGGLCVISSCNLENNALDGIRVSDHSSVQENTVIGPGTTLGTNACIHATSQANRIEANHVASSQIGIKIDNQNNLIIRNSAFFNGTNYFIPSANNLVGPTNSGFNITNNAWANFSL